MEKEQKDSSWSFLVAGFKFKVHLHPTGLAKRLTWFWEFSRISVVGIIVYVGGGGLRKVWKYHKNLMLATNGWGSTLAYCSITAAAASRIRLRETQISTHRK